MVRANHAGGLPWPMTEADACAFAVFYPPKLSS
jgi:hypothetical protein